MYDDYENGFSALLDELEQLHDKDGNRIGRPLRKAHSPAQATVRVAKISRSKHPMTARYEVGDHSGFNKTMRDLESLTNAMQHKPRAATLRLHKPRGTDLRKAMADFNTSLQKAMSSGEITPDQACLLEARRNRMMQEPLTGVI